MAEYGVNGPQGVLLHGRPETGKTMLVQALANEIEAKIVEVSSADIYGPWLGESGQRMQNIFDQVAQATTPTILFFDEIDSIVSITDHPGPGGADSERNSVAGIFKTSMNSLAKNNPLVLVVAATNKLDGIDESLRRSGRFNYTIHVPMPDDAARLQIMTNIVSRVIAREKRDFRIFADDLNLPELVAKTQDLSGADISEIFKAAIFKKAMESARAGQIQPPITQAEILQAINFFKTSG